MSKAFGDYVAENGLVFDGVEERLNEFRSWKKATKLDNKGEEVTEQSGKDLVDLNVVFKKYDRKGVARLQSQVEVDESKLADLVGFDYQEQMNTLKRVESEFAELPSEVRNSFKNDPGEYLKALSRPTPAKEDVVEHLKEKEVIKPPEAPKEPESSPEG